MVIGTLAILFYWPICSVWYSLLCKILSYIIIIIIIL